MTSGNGKHEDQLDDALENTFPGSDPVSMTQPQQRQGRPKQHSQTTAEAIEDNVQKIRPDYLWLGGAFVLGCLVGLAAGAAPSAFSRRSYGERMLDTGHEWKRKVSGRVSDLNLQRKLSDLIDRLR